MNKIKEVSHHLLWHTILPGLLLLSFGLGLFISQYLIYQAEARNGAEQVMDDQIYYQLNEWDNATFVTTTGEEDQEKQDYYIKQMEFLYDSLLEYQKKIEAFTNEKIEISTSLEQLEELKKNGPSQKEKDKKQEDFIESLHQDYDVLEEMFQQYMKDQNIEKSNEIRGDGN